MAALEPDAVVADIARRFDVTRQQVYDWRSAARRGQLALPGGVTGFVEVVAAAPGEEAAPDTDFDLVARAPAAAPAPTASEAGGRGITVEIVLAGGRMLRAPVDLPAGDLRRLIGVVERA